MMAYVGKSSLLYKLSELLDQSRYLYDSNYPISDYLLCLGVNLPVKRQNGAYDYEADA